MNVTRWLWSMSEKVAREIQTCDHNSGKMERKPVHYARKAQHLCGRTRNRLDIKSFLLCMLCITNTGLRTQAKGCSSPRPVLQGKASLHIFVSLAFNKSIMSNAHKRDFRLPTFVLPSVILRLAQVFLQSICAWHPGRQLPLLTWPWLADALGRDAVGSLAPGPV